MKQDIDLIKAVAREMTLMTWAYCIAWLLLIPLFLGIFALAVVTSRG